MSHPSPLEEFKSLVYRAWLIENPLQWPNDELAPCIPCHVNYVPQTRSDVALLRIAWMTQSGEHLDPSKRLRNFCGTRQCGNLGHYTTMRTRILEWDRAYKASDLSSITSYKKANHIDRKKRERVEDPGSHKEWDTDGRIVSPDGVVFYNICQAANHAGVDRIILAIELNRNQVTSVGKWHYAQGTYKETTAIYGDGLSLDTTTNVGYNLARKEDVYLSGRPKHHVINR